MNEEHKNSLLIVDDEESDLELLTSLLSSDYTVYTATSGANAIKKAKECMPDLILLDILMPGMNGYETFSRLKECDGTKEIPVIFITRLSSSEDEEKGLSLGAVDYISKPFSPMVVKLRIRNQIQIINRFHTTECLVMIDQLTNIPNRRSFDDRLGSEWSQSVREQKPLSLLMIDIDKFKNYNDTYGHPQGDVVLQTVARTLSHSCRRSSDFAARWGGEEFAVLLLNTPLAGALIVAERIRAGIEHETIPCADGSTTKVTVSIGVNTLVPMRDSPINAFISNADKALYAAKEAGRNRIAHNPG